MNYAKTQPELVILAVNTFVKVSDTPRGEGWNQPIPRYNPSLQSLATRGITHGKETIG